MDSISKNSEQYAIAKTIYNEARGEGDDGMAAVASTILNRKKLNRGYLGGSTLFGIVSKKS
jgi:spore germination cell wall hydrolase CwlJ-like protein